MPNAKELEKNSKICALFIGKSGTRKSTVGASFPGPRYMFDFDGRIGALRGVDIDFHSYPRLGGWGRAEDKFNQLIEEGMKGTPKYKTIHIASITTILNFFLWEVKQTYQEESKSGLYVTRPNSKNKRLLMSDMPHFKYVHAALDDLLHNLILPASLFYNIIIEGHEETKYDKDGDPEGDKLLASDSIAERIPTIFDETWQFKFKKSNNPNDPDDYRVWFRNNSLAKTTFRELPDSVCITNKEHVFYDEIFMRYLNGDIKK